MMKGRYKKVTSREYPSDVLRHRGIYCSSPERIKWCKKYLSRIYRRRMTNADKIRAMDDEELAEFMKPYDSGCPRWVEMPIPCSKRTNCTDCWLDWLKQDVTWDDRTQRHSSGDRREDG